MIKINYLKLIASIIVCLLIGYLGSFFTVSSINSWYSTLQKPSFNPPNWLFGPVWTFLYILMGISLYLVWNNKDKKGIDKKDYKIAIILFSIQLILNFLWSILFFALKSPLIAFIEIIVLWLMILFTIIYFRKISKVSSYLLIPYLSWVTFAAILNFSIYYLN